MKRCSRLVVAWAVLAGIALAGEAGAQFNVVISGTVFHDLDADGTFDAGEPGVAGVVVTVDIGADGEIDDQTTTGPLGTYSQLAPPGTYRLRIVVPDGFIQTTADPPDIVAEQGSVHVADFGIAAVSIPTLDGWGTLLMMVGLGAAAWAVLLRAGTANHR